MRRKTKIMILVASLLIAVLLLASCGEDSASENKKETESSINFESIIDTETDVPDNKKDSETTPPDTEAESETEKEEPGVSSDKGLAALALAEKLIGTKFKMGGIGPDEFDNSGFIYYIFKESGAAVPRLARDMAGFGKAVGRGDLMPGDILVFANEIGGGAEFVGIYAGDNKFIACNNPDSPTALQSIGNYWEARFISGRRAG